MSDIPDIFTELVAAIEKHGPSLTLADDVRTVIDQYDMLIIDRSSGDSVELDFGIRKGAASIIAHFICYPQVHDGGAHVAYDVDWHGAPEAGQDPQVERRSWSWDIPLPAELLDDDQPAFEFTRLQ